MILGVKITQTQNRVMLSQTHYVNNIIEKINLSDSSTTRTPIVTCQHP